MDNEGFGATGMDRFEGEIVDAELVDETAIVAVDKPGAIQSQASDDFRSLVEYAERRPRPPIKTIAKAVVDEARIMAETAFWSWEVWDSSKGRKVPIFGPTADLAFALQRHYRNIVVRSELIRETEDEYVFRAMAIDLESFATIERTHYQPKFPKHLRAMAKKDPGRHKSMVIGTGESKAERNVLLKMIPASLKNLAIETAIDRVQSEVNPANIQKMVAAFVNLGATEEQLIDYLGNVPSAITVAQFANMKSLYASVRRGELTLDEALAVEEEEEKDEDLDELTPERMKQ